MAPWSVVNGDNQQDRPRPPYFRYALLGLAALLVLALGISLIPAEQQPPAGPTSTETARASALAEALELRADGKQLAASALPDGGATAATAEVVTLLTLQARALLAPGEVFPAPGTAASSSSPAAGTPAGPEPAASSSASASGSTAPSAAGSASDSGSGSGKEPGVTAAGLAAELADSGRTRLRDAAKVDGGMARLLAGAGIAQLLAAEKLASAAGDPAAAGQDSAAPEPEETADLDGQGAGTTGPAGPQDSANPLDPDGQGSGTTGPAPAPGSPAAQDLPCPALTAEVPDAGAALAGIARLEEQAIYGYQAALTRLSPGAVGPASEFLELHREQAAAARSRSLADCGSPSAPDPGYNLDAAFLAGPVTGLGRLEADILPAYGDAVALADSPDRAWSIAGLEAAARRAVYWGADPGPVPGLVLDESSLPAGPAGSSPRAG